MRYRPLGNSGIEASVVGLGAWAIGGWMWGGADEQQSIRTIHAALDQGINLIDTAPVYGFGQSEEVVGRAIRNCRQRVVLATKCGLVWDRREGEFFFHADEKRRTDTPAKFQVYRCLRPDSIRRECEESLRRLGTDYIDLYQTHWPDSTTPIEQTVEVLLQLQQEGKIRAFGTSNVSVDQLAAYGGRAASTQERFSMLDRRIEQEGLLEYCRENNIAVLAYSPLEQGLLTGKVGPDRQFPEGDQRRTKPRFSVENRRKAQAMLDRFRPIATRHQATLTQLTIAWTFSQPGLTHVLCGARSPEQVAENAAAASVQLCEEELVEIEEIIGTSGVE